MFSTIIVNDSKKVQRVGNIKEIGNGNADIR